MNKVTLTELEHIKGDEWSVCIQINAGEVHSEVFQRYGKTKEDIRGFTFSRELTLLLREYPVSTAKTLTKALDKAICSYSSDV